MLRFRKPTKLSGENHQLIINKKSKKLIIFFTGTGAKAGHFFFYSTGQKLNCNVLFINNGENQWYQEGIPSLGTQTFEETIDILKKWIDYLGVTEIYSCGASMGAYGAILYGCYLNANVLAFGPEIELCLLGSRSINYIKEGQKIHFNLIDVLKKSTNKIYIYVGEDDPIDVYNASKVASFINYPNIFVYSVPDVTHSVGQYLKTKNKLVEFLNIFINGNKLPVIDKDSDVCIINGFAEVYYKQYSAFRNKNWEGVVKYGTSATQLNQISSFSQYMLGLSYVQSDNLNTGLIHLSLARTLSPLNLNYQFAVANCLRRMGKMTKARYLHQKILQVNKDYAKSHYDLSLIYNKLGDKKGAIARAKHALRVEPKSVNFQKRVEKLTQATKK